MAFRGGINEGRCVPFCFKREAEDLVVDDLLCERHGGLLCLCERVRRLVVFESAVVSCPDFFDLSRFTLLTRTVISIVSMCLRVLGYRG
jgi:hypothetical protein